MKLSEYRNVEALEMLGEIIEPVSKIFSDKKVVGILEGKGAKLDGVSYVLKTYPNEIVKILARFKNVDVEEYDASLTEMFSQVMEILNDEELISFFTSQGKKMEQTSFGSATENIKGKGK